MFRRKKFCCGRWRLSFPGSAGVIKSKHTLKYVKKINNLNLPAFAGSCAQKQKNKILFSTALDKSQKQDYIKKEI